MAADDRATGLVVDAVAGEDASTSERELIRPRLAAAELDPRFVADHHFGTTAIRFGIGDRRA